MDEKTRAAFLERMQSAPGPAAADATPAAGDVVHVSSVPTAAPANGHA